MQNIRPYLKRYFLALDAEKKSLADLAAFPFLQLPSELRLKVYYYLFAGRRRQIDIYALDHRKFPGRCRPSYPLDHPEDYPWSSNHLLLNSLIADEYPCICGLDIHVSVLRTCRHIHAEAEPELYLLHKFAFRDEMIGIEPFLSRLSSTARYYIMSMSFTLTTQHELPTDNHSFVQWQLAHVDMEQALTYIANSLRLKELDVLLNIGLVENCYEESWAKSLVKIKGLEILRFPAGPSVVWILYPERLQVSEDDPTRQRRISKLLRFLTDEMLAQPPSKQMCSFDLCPSSEKHTCG